MRALLAVCPGVGVRGTLIVIAVAGAGCSPSLTLKRDDKPDAQVEPTEDGTMYIRADSGVLSSPNAARAKWRRAARKACTGDYMVLSEAASSRRVGGLARSHAHEGFVRCVAPEAIEIAREDKKTRRQATRRRQRRPAARRPG